MSSMMRRRGFTLVEMLVALAVLGIVGASLTRVLVNTFRVSQAQVMTADMQSNVRLGGLVLPLELREIGYDSNIYIEPAGVGAITSDLLAIAPDAITFRAMRGWSPVCDIASDLLEFKIRKPTFGQRRPLSSDGFLLFVENLPALRWDDQWVPLISFKSLAPNELCGADSAIAIKLTGKPLLGAGKTLEGTHVKVGAPVRYFEVMQFGMFVDADGRTYLGARSLSLNEVAYRAVAGPLDAANGLRFTYYDGNGNEVDPAIGIPGLVRTIDLRLEGETRGPVSMMGSAERGTGSMVTVTRVALRNTMTY
jgi:prepilin-type N-terminal cleavage/methylation domain-containing protein